VFWSRSTRPGLHQSRAPLLLASEVTPRCTWQLTALLRAEVILVLVREQRPRVTSTVTSVSAEMTCSFGGSHACPQTKGYISLPAPLRWTTHRRTAKRAIHKCLRGDQFVLLLLQPLDASLGITHIILSEKNENGTTKIGAYARAVVTRLILFAGRRISAASSSEVALIDHDRSTQLQFLRLATCLPDACLVEGIVRPFLSR
jgi:hypothetical protein